MGDAIAREKVGQLLREAMTKRDPQKIKAQHTRRKKAKARQLSHSETNSQTSVPSTAAKDDPPPPPTAAASVANTNPTTTSAAFNTCNVSIVSCDVEAPHFDYDVNVNKNNKEGPNIRDSRCEHHVLDSIDIDNGMKSVDLLETIAFQYHDVNTD